MKVKVALEFEFEIDSSMESDDICYYTDIRDLVDMIDEYMDNNSFGIRYTGEWQYITENNINYKCNISQKIISITNMEFYNEEGRGRR